MDRIRRTPHALAFRHASLLAVVLTAAVAGPSSVQAVSFHPPVVYATGSQPYNVAVGDFNGDGKPDLVTANYSSGGGNNVSVLLGTGAGAFGNHTDVVCGGSGPLSVAIGDLNSDGKPDLAVACINSNTIQVLLGNGAGAFGSPSALPPVPCRSPSRWRT